VCGTLRIAGEGCESAFVDVGEFFADDTFGFASFDQSQGKPFDESPLAYARDKPFE